MEYNVKYLLIGGGLAAANAAEAIRQHDDSGSILLAGREKYPPYDRPPHSKDFLSDDEKKPEDTYSKPDDFYAENRVELLLGVKATDLDPGTRTVTFNSGDTARYERLLLATGARPNSLPGVSGQDLPGVFLLRTADDSQGIRAAIKSAKKAVMIGAGFIGMEVAAVCVERGLDVTILTHGDKIWSQLKPSADLNNFIRSAYEEKGVTFLFNEEVASFEGSGKLQSVRTKSGKTIEADLAVVAVGVTLNTELAKDAGLEVDEKQGVNVDSSLRTSDPNIFTAGDISYFDDVALGKRWHVEHYMNAMWQGEAVGAIMAGEEKPFDQVAYFFSDILLPDNSLSMIMRGDPDAGKQSKVLGDLNGGEFVELYHDESGSVRMGVAFSHDYEKLEPISEKLEAFIREKKNVNEIDQAAVGI